jgi:4-aminobutyrate aminotransferase-like enzyme
MRPRAVDRAREAVERITRFRGGGPRPFADATGIVVERGAGSRLHDLSGNAYIDTVAGFGVASLGHSHPAWVEAVIDQARRLAVAPLDTDQLGDYLSALGPLMPHSLSRIALFSGGAEAVEMAVRLAQTSTGRPGLLAFEGGFHGKTAALRYVRLSGSDEASQLGPGWLRLSDYPVCTCDGPTGYADCQESGADVLEALRTRTDLDDVAAVIVEPIQGTAGNLVPPRRFLPALRELCDARGWLLILDESITGFGRTGRLFACELFDVRPDIMVLSKGLGGGFPLTAVCTSPALWASSALDQPSGTTTAFGANPLSCAAGLATLHVLTGAGFLEHVEAMAAHAARRLEALNERTGRVARPRGVGLLLGFDQVDASTGEVSSLAACESVARACIERGVLTAAHVPRVRLNPPLIITRDELDVVFDVFEETLA